MKHFYKLTIAYLPFACLLVTGAQAQGPTVVGAGLRPARNAVAVPRTTSVVVPFSKAVSPATAGNIKLFSAQARGRCTAVASTIDSTVTLTPTAPAGQSAAFKPGETVYVTVPATVQSTAGSGAVPAVYQFTAAASGGTGRFLAGTDPTVGPNPQCVVLGDVDGDGDLDVVTANYNSSGTVSVRLNNGSGVFGGGSDPAVGSYPTSVVLGDVDGDGDLDLVTSNAGASPSYGNTVSIRLNDGTGNFTAPATNPNPTVGTNPKGLALGDIDGDGDLDLLTANYDVRNGTVSVRLNNGTGNFTAPAANAEVPAYYGTTGIALGDLDNDGDLDFVTANSTAISLSFRYNDGQGNFTSSTGGGQAPAGTASSLALGDIDGDGDLDCVSANTSTSYNPTKASMVYNSNGGYFGISFGIEIGPQSSAVALADVDGDGDLDLVAAIGGNNTATVRLNNGYSSFAATSNTVAVTVGVNPRSIAVGDLDGDGDLDLVTANAGPASAPGNTVSVRFNALDANVVSTTPLRNAIAAPLSRAPTLTFRQALNPATVGDVRLHRQQGAGLHTAGASGATVTLAPPAGSRAAFWPGEAVQVTVPATVGSASGTAAVPYVYNFTAAATGGTGLFVPGSTVSVGATPYQVTAGDIDNDGDLDMLTATYSGNTGAVVVHRNNGLGVFGSPITVSVLGLAQCVELADIDNDGDQDLIVGGRLAGGGAISIRLNNGAGSFSGTQDIITGENVTTLAIGDIDGDGDLDFIPPSNSFIMRYFNDGFGVFAGSAGRGNIASPQVSMKLFDVDGDADLDLVAAYRYASGSIPNATVATWLNDGSGEFANATTAKIGSLMVGMVVGDVDGDGDVDLLLSEYGGAAYLLLNNGQGAFTGGASPLPNVTSGELTFGDVDGDGDLDILSNDGGRYSTAQVSVRMNDGNGNFSGNTTVIIGPGPLGTSALGTKLADIDNDGDLDMLTPHDGNNNVSIRFNDGNPLATAKDSYLTAARCLFPNPASASETVTVNCSVPANVRVVRATLLNTLGQAVAVSTVPVQAGQATGALPISGLAPGVYMVQLLAGATTLTTRLVLL